MGNQNRHVNDDEMTHAREVVREAFPGLEVEFGGHGDYGGGRAPRDHTISFRLRDAHCQLRSHMVWVLPQHLNRLTVANVRSLVARANGKLSEKEKRRKKRK